MCLSLDLGPRLNISFRGFSTFPEEDSAAHLLSLSGVLVIPLMAKRQERIGGPGRALLGLSGTGWRQTSGSTGPEPCCSGPQA